jgi:hypothetical protein
LVSTETRKTPPSAGFFFSVILSGKNRGLLFRPEAKAAKNPVDLGAHLALAACGGARIRLPGSGFTRVLVR